MLHTKCLLSNWPTNQLAVSCLGLLNMQTSQLADREFFNLGKNILCLYTKPNPNPNPNNSLKVFISVICHNSN